MSEMYEGVVFRANERVARRLLASISSPLRLRLVRLTRGIFGVYRVAGRAEPFDQPEMERVAETLSRGVPAAVALFFDNSCGIRVGVRYVNGQRDREFGDSDAWWVPFDERGRLERNGPRFRLAELRRDVEYDCVATAIDAALGAIGASGTISSNLLTQAFCYERIPPITELNNTVPSPQGG